MAANTPARIRDHFARLADPRRREPVHPPIHIATIAVCAVVAGADDFVAVARYGRITRDSFAKFLDLPAGIPTRLRRIWSTTGRPRGSGEATVLMTLHPHPASNTIRTDGAEVAASHHADPASPCALTVPVIVRFRCRRPDIAASQVERGGSVHDEVRHHVLGRYVSAERFAEAVRRHRGIENRLHRRPDVTFREDECRVRNGQGDAHRGHVRRTARAGCRTRPPPRPA